MERHTAIFIVKHRSTLSNSSDLWVLLFSTPFYRFDST